MEKLLKINLGGGTEKIEGFTNIDILPLPEVDIIADLNKGIPLQDNSVSGIWSSHCLEHLNNTVKIMEEIYRVCKPGALVKIKVPYFKSIGAFKDPSHKQFFTEHTFDYFSQEKVHPVKCGFAAISLKAKLFNRAGPMGLPDYQIKANFKIEKISYLWSRRCLRYIPFKKALLLPYLWNIARSVYFELRVIK